MKDASGRSDESLPVRRLQTTTLGQPAADFADDFHHEMPPPMAGKKVSFKLFTRAMKRHWWQAFLLWLVVSGALVYLAHTRIKPTYDARSQVKVETDNTQIFGAGTHQVDLQQFMQNQAATIASPTIVGAALAEHPELLATSLLKNSDDREGDFIGALRVGIVPRTNYIQVEMSSTVPSEAAQLVNAVVEAYLKHAQATYDTSTQKRIDLLKATKGEQEAEVNKQRLLVQSLKDQGKKLLEDNAKDKNNTSLEAYKRLSEELTNVEIMVITAKAKLDQLRNLKELPRAQGTQGAEQIDMQVADMFLAHPTVMGLQSRLDQAKTKLREAERLAKSHADPSRTHAADRVKELETQREALWLQLEPSLRKQLVNSPVDMTVENEIKAAEIDLASKTIQQETLQNRLNQVRIENTAAQAEENKLEYAQKDLQRADNVFDRIVDSLNQYQFNARNPTARVELSFAASPTVRPNSDKRRQLMAVAPIATGLLLIMSLLMLELRGARVSDPEELSSRMHLQVIGVVPPLPQIRIGLGGNGNGNGNGDGNGNGSGPPSTSGDIRAQRQLDEFVQSLDHLRVALCARRDPWGRDRHCVLITSACGSEGKTTLAAQLAERCVNAGLMTLLIDADLRNPTLSRMLDAVESPGLINVLRGEMLAEDVVTVVSDAGGFHLLPAGTPRVDPSRLLQGDRLGKLIAQARESFEMIIVDAPPVLPVPDALTIGRWTDGAVLAVRYDTSRFPLVEKANRRLATVGVPVIGAVVNGVRSMEAAYGGYYGYGYGSTVYGNAVPTTTAAEESRTVE